MKFLNLFLTAQLAGSVAFAQIKINPIKNPSGLPIKPERTISISTNESSYLDVDMSPDGSTILFTCLGEIFSLPARGGVATQLTRGLAMNRCPIWSSDGKLIAYESDATGFVGLHVTNLSGSFHKVLSESSYTGSQILVWFPDSKNIAYGWNVYHLTGTSSNLPQNVKGRILGFSPDGKFVYFQEDYTSDLSAIIKYNRVNWSETKSYVMRQDCNNARISPDGNWLIYIKYRTIDRNDHLYTPADSLMAIEMNSGKEKLLAHLNIKFTTEFPDKQHYSFSKESKYLYIGYGGKIHCIEVETGKNEIIPFTANVKVDMGTLNYHRFTVRLDSFNVKYIRAASKSPDGKHLVFSALNKIYKMDLPNGKPHILIDQPINQFEPAYSLDGKWICYVSWNDNEGGHVWRIPASGGIPEQLTTVPALYQHPSWSPDGKRIVVLRCKNKLEGRFTGKDGQIEIISVTDKTANLITGNTPFFSRPVFSLSGEQIIFTPKPYSPSKSSPIVISKNIKDSSETALAHANQPGFFPFRTMLLSPDGNYTVFVENEDLYLAPMANIGGVQNIFDVKDPVQLIRFARGAIDPVWEQGGKVLSWLDGYKFCSINPAKIIEAAEHLQPQKTLKGLPQTKIIEVAIPADQTITINLKASSIYGNGMIALKNARIITMHNDQFIKNGTVVIINGRVVSVGETNKITIPREAEIFDLKEKTIMPGFVDVHGHMDEAFPPDIFLQQSWQRLLAFSYGITTRRNPSSTIDEFGYNELTQTGQMLGPRSFTVGLAVRPSFNLNSLHEARTIASIPVKYGATYIKQYGQDTRLQRQLLLQACKDAKVNMTNEVEKEPLYCLGMYKDGSTGVEHNPWWGEVYDDVTKLVAKSGTYLCPTLQVCYGQEEGKGYFRKLYGQALINRSSRFLPDSNEWYRHELSKDMNATIFDPRLLQQSRINVSIKHAAGKIEIGNYVKDHCFGAPWEVWALQMGELTIMEALETARITASDALGMQKDLESIEAGKIAALVIGKNPFKNIRNTLSSVFSRGLKDENRKTFSKDLNATVLDSGFLYQSSIDARIKHAGGKIVMGSHGEDQGIGAHWEIWALKMGGLTNYEALQTATITAAEALGMQKDLGSIEVGKIADLIILDKNPLDDIHNTNTIKYVMKAGVLYEADTLNEIWPEKKKCPEWRMKDVKSETSNVKK